MDSNSILDSIKKTLTGLEDDSSFDIDLIMFINTTLSTLSQLGAGPVKGLFIEDDSKTWDELIPDDDILLGFVKTYVQQKTKLRFDPPTSGSHMEALKESIAELEWRIELHTSSSTSEENK